jgi:hypothetical protein
MKSLAPATAVTKAAASQPSRQWSVTGNTASGSSTKRDTVAQLAAFTVFPVFFLPPA